MKIILDLCGGTGAWSRPYKESGNFDVFVVTLPRYDVFDTIINDSSITFFDRIDKKNIVVPKKDIYGIFAAPTCTMFSLARTRAKTPRDFEEGMKLVKQCLNIIWAVRAFQENTLHFWALENPRGFLRQFLGKPPLSFTADEYGANVKKPTDIWGYFNIPKKQQKNQNATNLDKNLSQIPSDYIIPDDMNREAVKRAITNKEFATAFYKVNCK